MNGMFRKSPPSIGSLPAMYTSDEIAVVLMKAIVSTSHTRKRAALMLANAMRRNVAVHEEIDAISADAAREYGTDVAAEIRTIASDLRLL